MELSQKRVRHGGTAFDQVHRTELDYGLFISTSALNFAKKGRMSF